MASPHAQWFFRRRCRRGCLLWLCLFAQALTSACTSSSNAPNNQTTDSEAPPSVRDKPLVGIIDAGKTGPFDVTLRAGMEAGAMESAIDLQWFSSSSGEEADLITQLSTAGERNLDALCIQPFLSSEVVVDAMRRLRRDATPVIFFRDSIPGADFVAGYVGTDHFHAGRRLAEAVVERASDETAVILASAPAGDANATTRQRGFEFTMAEVQPNLALSTFDGDSLELAERSAALLEALNELKEGPRIVVAFTHGDTEAIVDALESELSTEGDVHVIGFGSYRGIADDLRRGILACTLIEDPYLMGLSTTVSIAAEIEGKFSGEFISSGEHLIVADQLDDAGMSKLLLANEHQAEAALPQNGIAH